MRVDVSNIQDESCNKHEPSRRMNTLELSFFKLRDECLMLTKKKLFDDLNMQIFQKHYK